MDTSEPLISEAWLERIGCRWHQIERQPCRHWLLWLGGVIDGGLYSTVEDLGIEVALTSPENTAWFCWLRADTGHRYSRFIHLRHIESQRELIAIIEALTGHVFDPQNNLYGRMHTAEVAAQIRLRETRLDRVLMHATSWTEIERDESRGGALPEYVEFFENSKSPKKRL